MLSHRQRQKMREKELKKMKETYLGYSSISFKPQRDF